MGELISVQQVHKHFDDLHVLRGLDMTVAKGEVVAIIGSSGSGKSTLVRCISGLEEINGGDILVDGQSVSCAKCVSGKVGMVFQNFNLFPHYSVGENITKPLQTVGRLSKAAALAKAQELLAKVHLADKIDQYPNMLSGGQKQRVAIARALAMEPEIMVFDEPTSSLDPELAHEVFETISDLAKEGQTMLIVTHQIQAIRKFASRVVFLSQGQIAADGSPEYIFTQCEDASLRQFLKQVDFADL